MATRFGWRVRTSLQLAALCLSIDQRATASEQADGLTVRISIENPDHAFEKDLLRARKIAEELYRQADVSLVWVDREQASSDAEALRVVVEPSSAVSRHLGAEAMGVAPSPGDGTRGSLAYVFSDRVVAFAASYHLSMASVLGCALAHEIGHLLLPVNAHAGGGIMRATWTPDLYAPRSPGLPGLEPQQAKLMRTRLMSRGGPAILSPGATPSSDWRP